MKCLEIQEVLFDYVDGLLTEEQTMQINEHINDCDVCMKKYQELSKLLNECRRLNALELPLSFHSRVHTALVNANSVHSKNNRWWKMMVGAAAVVILIMTSRYSQIFLYGREKAEQSVRPMEIQDAALMKAAPGQNNPTVGVPEKACASSIFDQSYQSEKEDRGKKLRRIYISLQVKALNDDSIKIMKDIRMAGGYILDTDFTKDGTGQMKKSGYVKARVPLATMDKIIKIIERRGVTKKVIRVEDDIQREFESIDARIDSLRNEKKRLQNLMRNTPQFTSLLLMNTKITNIQDELEDIKNYQNEMNEKASESEWMIHLYQ